MTRDEFERCRRRFGDTVEAWPAPFRQQALALMAQEQNDDPDAALDRLVLKAAQADGDDHALARKVLARIDAGSARPFFLWRPLLSPTGLAACAAAALVAATLAGYQVARLQDDPSDTELLALASGSSLADAGGVVADPEGEGSL
ncbi:hypothetical protein [Mesorhizobium erdmanii]|uniref:Uncharacterized protein n=1 Tax=Mesorhizobium erdmanii TaxID=1777866 RepID=A0A6M7UKC9_9HYPH|nr:MULTISPECIES: hypothetical protein [Mesorhizobium]OBQ70998.1 hypothetical protein A8146_26400 [Mesorhizobium loti]QKC76578.1 hypothetical protein EB233_14470 [Mesorhizobium erdmanii]